MFQHFEVKPLFEDQIHERHQFSVYLEGSDYNGLYHEGEISWFNPQPQHILEEQLIVLVEAEIHRRMQDHSF
ncbi:DUF5342 family protein [Paenibacillus sp. FA6]|uniref:DUF5342 family protein n=1 Tax=Paenibacillus sp. FA6 TaxID=3413029 RepID=UPI003F65D523